MPPSQQLIVAQIAAVAQFLRDQTFTESATAVERELARRFPSISVDKVRWWSLDVGGGGGGFFFVFEQQQQQFGG